MYAIVNIAGKQYKVEKSKYLYTDKLAGEAGAKVEFDSVLLIADGAKVDVGAPVVKGAKVTGKILDQVKDDKVVIFKKKRRKGYRKSQGHRQQLTKVLIEEISK
ncbi:MAG: 50S ribosomal protein L21 [Cytophagaceae bacterium]|jgi:large subunit ribosomal protein L21|nr:50S ribosomal protein L21 [Cytophagaceae bacterium]